MRVARVMPTGQAVPARAFAELRECGIFNGVAQNLHGKSMGKSVMHNRISTVRTKCTWFCDFASTVRTDIWHLLKENLIWLGMPIVVDRAALDACGWWSGVSREQQAGIAFALLVLVACAVGLAPFSPSDAYDPRTPDDLGAPESWLGYPNAPAPGPVVVVGPISPSSFLSYPGFLVSSLSVVGLAASSGKHCLLANFARGSAPQ